MGKPRIKREADIVQQLIELKGPAFKAYRDKWDKVNRFELETDFPMFLHIEPNYTCNFECPMCTQGIPELKEKFGYKERLTTEGVAKILAQAKAHGCPSISFQGDNEPFLIKEITTWFEMARDAGILDIMVNTNGSVMTADLARRIVKSGLTRIRFSLDAVTEETYKKIRVGGQFQRTYANIDLFLKIREELGSPLPRVGVNFVKTSMNEHEVDAFEAYWNPKVDFIVIQDFMTPDVQGAFEHLDVDGRAAVDDFKCNQPWQRLYLRGNGDVTPCCAMFSSYLKLGDHNSAELADLWNSKEAKDLRKLHAEGRYKENPICLKCSKNGGGGA